NREQLFWATAHPFAVFKMPPGSVLLSVRLSVHHMLELTTRINMFPLEFAVVCPAAFLWCWRCWLRCPHRVNDPLCRLSVGTTPIPGHKINSVPVFTTSATL